MFENYEDDQLLDFYEDDDLDADDDESEIIIHSRPGRPLIESESDEE